METIGERLKRLRKARGLSQIALGAKAGIAQPTISGIEKGERQTQPSSLIELAHALNTEAYYLKYGKGKEDINSSLDETQQLLLSAFPLLDESVREIWIASAKSALQKADDDKRKAA